MPACVYLSDAEERKWSSVAEDKDCDELLQQLRRLTGNKWLVERQEIPVRHTSLWKHLFCKSPPPHVEWTLYADLHGEHQVINLVTPEGGSVFYKSTQSRENVMNFMLGYIAGIVACLSA